MTITVKDSDSWLFRGFGGAIKLFKRRANEYKDVPISVEVLQKLEIASSNLEFTVKRLGSFPTGDAEIQQIDHELAEGILSLTNMVVARTRYPKVQAVQAVDILQDELQDLNRLIVGLKELNRRIT